MTEGSSDQDSPWKEALEQWFPDFMALLFPEIHREIDWSQGYRFLDKELQKTVRDAELGRRYADKLVKVTTLANRETWVLVHIEVQGQREVEFDQRMYVYNYRLYDRYQVDVVSLAVLADDAPSFRAGNFQRGLWGCEVRFRYPSVKLLDLAEDWSGLEANPNPFALVVMAQIRALERAEPRQLKDAKFGLFRLMLGRGYDKSQILELLRIIDWLMVLPAALESELADELDAYGQENKMPYITSFERVYTRRGIHKGHTEILHHQLKEKFGSAYTPTYREQVDAAESEQILGWSSRLLTAETIEEVFSK
jgi:hypothetical protein